MENEPQKTNPQNEDAEKEKPKMAQVNSQEYLWHLQQKRRKKRKSDEE